MNEYKKSYYHLASLLSSREGFTMNGEQSRERVGENRSKEVPDSKGKLEGGREKKRRERASNGEKASIVWIQLLTIA